MATRDLHDNIKVRQLLNPQTISGSSNVSATSLDTRGFDSAELMVAVGQSGDALSGTRKFDLKLEDSDDNAAFAAVTSADAVLVGADAGVSLPDASGVFATIDSATKDRTKYRIGYRGRRRYLRTTIALTGTHTAGTPMAVIGLLGHAHLAPVAD